jgi:hypothetical protein
MCTDKANPLWGFSKLKGEFRRMRVSERGRERSVSQSIWGKAAGLEV